MAAYASYEFYRNEYGGSAIDDGAFDSLANRAAAYINAATGGRAKTANGDDLEAVRMANCELAEVFQDESKLNAVAFSATGAVASESVGGWSRSYGTKSVGATDLELLEKRKKNALLMYLQGTGFLSAVGYPMNKGGGCW